MGDVHFHLSLSGGGGALSIPAGTNHPRMERSSGEAKKEKEEKGNQSSVEGFCAIFVKDSTKVWSG